jgi:hypothetical protein
MFPLIDEILAIHERPMFENVHRAMRAQHRAHCNRAFETYARLRRARSDAQREIAAEREACKRRARDGKHRLDAAHRAGDFIEAARMKQLFVQVMTRTVIAKVESEYIAPAIE